MRITSILLTTLLLALVPGVTNADTTYTGGDAGNWHDLENWSAGVPDASDVATITNNHYPQIDNSATALCKSLVIDNANSGVTILAGATLVLGDGSARTSTMDNTSNFLNVAGTLTIDGVHTFNGKGTIRLTDYDNASIVEANDGNDVLILESDCGASPIEQACTITLAGEGEVAVRLDNRAFVIADVDAWPDGLHLTTREKTTDDEAEGYWIAENGGNLLVETLVTGPGEWHVTDTDCTSSCQTRGTGCNGLIKVVAGTDGCVVGTGDVFLEAGCKNDTDAHALKVETNVFCTTGKLRWRSVFMEEGPPEIWSNPGIKVSTDASARFGLSEPCSSSDCGGS